MVTTQEKIYLMRPWIEEEIEAIKEVLISGFLTEGPKVAEFEKAFASYVGSKHAIATTSCTTALELALRVLGIGPGDEVIVPDFTYPATADVVYLVGAEPILVDVDLQTYNITPEAIKTAVTNRTKAVIPVSLFGQPLSEEVYITARELGLFIIEDAACSAGATIKGKKVGSIADITCFSFHPRKVITTGEGGMLTTNNDEWAEKTKCLKKFGLKRTEKGMEFFYIGTNYKMSDILGAIGLSQLKKIENIIEDRRTKAHYYTKLIKEAGLEKFLLPPWEVSNLRHTFQTYACYVKVEGARDKLREFFLEHNVETQIGTFALHLQPAFKNTKKADKCKNSRLLYENLIALPLHHLLTKEQQEFIIKVIKKFFKNKI
ncbi:MAG TPA: DegT/DnrJ/EryC1/StrS family aminotransferase [Candidatus Desulfofervidus auxilii]|uniref:DegT/DnrJ/EryC1/StrS family aminotransferase n=1 Tax=Desulfofervidus auxilii TaxID=1621989 RepID=A0A7C0Y8E7_DESA2|nr:DegT/DnrJ/EryC1/StrS family aminotransferase [Candidatus Desulfofervidus auxilii]